jgi:hypothetical protein
MKKVFEIVGREEELASLNAFVGEVHGGFAALVPEGEAGIGKSTLWEAGVEYARSQGVRVISARPAEAERGLAHVGLGDLLSGRFISGCASSKKSSFRTVANSGGNARSSRTSIPCAHFSISSAVTSPGR